MSNSSPRSWVIATLILLASSVFLLIALICTCILVCNAKRKLKKKRCRGICRFGCKCSSDAIRQAAADAAVCGPLGQPASLMTNGSVLGYANINRSCYLGYNGKHSVTPIYVSMGTNDKLMGVQASDSPNLQNMEFQSSNMGSNIIQGQNWPQYQLSMSKSNRVSHNGIWRSRSDGSSLSENTERSVAETGLHGQRIRQTISPFNKITQKSIADPFVNNYDNDETNSEKMPGSQKIFDDYKLKQIDMKMSTIQDINKSNYDQKSFPGRPLNISTTKQNGYNQNDLFDNSISAPDPANITPPEGFFDKNNDTGSKKICDSIHHSESIRASMNKSWMPENDLENLPRSKLSSSLFRQISKTSSSISQPLGGVKVLPTSGNFPSLFSSSTALRRRNGYLNCSIDEDTMAGCPTKIES